MSALELIAKLRTAGINLSVNNGKIRVRAESGSLTDELKQELTVHKAEIIALLSGGQTANAAELKPVNRDSSLALSYAQQRLWFLDELEPGTPVYNMPYALSVHGNLDIAALQRAFADVINHHESLRTIFSAANSNTRQPQQIILDTIETPIAFESLVDAADETLANRLRELAQQRFDLATGPLLKLHVLEQEANRHILLLVIHHIISDLWSLDVFFRDLGNFYALHTKNTSAQPPTALTIQYADYAAWQRETLDGAQLDQQLKHWQQALKGAPPILEIPTDYPRPSEPGYQGNWIAISMSQAVSSAVKELARKSNCTPFMLTFAAFALLLNRYSSADDLVIGTPISGRSKTELEKLVGFFLNTLPLRVDLSGNPSFIDLLQQIRTTALAAYSNQDLPFEKLVDELRTERNMSHTPVFQHMFIWQENNANQISLPGLVTDPATLISHDTAKFDLTMALTDMGEQIEAGIEYNTDLFDRTTIERMLGHWETLLTAVVANPDAPLASVSLLDEAERTQVLSDFNQTDVTVEPLTVAQLVDAQVTLSPDAIAVRMAEETLSYTELSTQANILAHELVTLGAAGQTVAICYPRDIRLPIAALACVKAGACYVPVDPAYPAERIQAMLADAQPTAVLTHSSVTLPDQSAPVLVLDELTLDQSVSDVAGPALSDALYCIYTSGSTGTPKGVQLSQQGLANLLQWQMTHERLSRPAKTLQFASFSFDVSFQELFSTWCTGGELVMISEDQRQDLSALAGFIAEQNIERVYLPFAALQPLAESWEHSSTALSLNDIVVAGEQLKVTPAIRSLFTRLDKAALHNQYGPSETHVVTALTLTGDANDWPTLPSIGTPVANTRCYALDEQQQPVPIGLPGELYLGGAQIALGYLNRPKLDQDKFIASPFVAGDRLYRSGDRVRFKADGQIEFLGRVDDQVKWRGFRIEPGEIEAALTGQNSVEDAVIIIREDTGDARLVAYVTPGASTPDTQQLAQALKTSLPDYMQPSIIVVLDEMPLTPSGKVARRALPAPDYSSIQTAPFVAPRTPTEEALVSLWQQVLKLERISVHDDFFQLGGHSLLATQLIARVRDQFAMGLPLKYIFRYPSPEGLAGAIDTIKASQTIQQTEPNSDHEELRI